MKLVIKNGRVVDPKNGVDAVTSVSIDAGKVVEDGTHAELLELNGHYARMWNMQAGGFLPDRE